MMKTSIAALLLPFALFCQTNPIVRFQTNLGDIDVELYADVAPKTVANFFSYINKGAYTNTIIHRSVSNFIIQGGGFTLTNTSVNPIPSDAAVQSEYNVSNTRGTIAMALSAGNANSGTNQWFFNLVDANADILNPQSFTVFGKATDSSLAVIDAIARTPKYDSPWSTMAGDNGGTPLLNYRQGQVVQPSNFIVVRSIRPLGRAISAGGFGGYTEAAAGSYLEVYGTNLSASTRTWAESDFRNSEAPTTVDNVSVTVGGRPAFISYVSPTQVNVQVPADVTPAANVPVVVTHNGQEKVTANITVKAVAPGLLAPSSFKVGDYQYVVAQHRNGSFVSNGFITGVPSAPAIPGEVLIIYGVGFGPVTPSSTAVAGRIAQGLSSTSNPVQFFFGEREATVEYSGLAPGLVGLYQFNVVVPAGLGAQDLPLRVKVAGADVPQTLFIPVGQGQ